MSASWGYKDMPSQEGKTFVVTVRCNCTVCSGRGISCTLACIWGLCSSCFSLLFMTKERIGGICLSLCAAVAWCAGGQRWCGDFACTHCSPPALDIFVLDFASAAGFAMCSPDSRFPCAGIGFVTAKELAKKGGHVVMTARSEDKGQKCAATVTQSHSWRLQTHCWSQVRCCLQTLHLAKQRSRLQV